AMFKQAKMNMHEKFVLFDNKNPSNSSANMSGGAESRYSEDFTFVESEGAADNGALPKQFEPQFAVLWISSDDLVTAGELQKADVLPLDIDAPNLPSQVKPMTLFSSSMNSLIEQNKPSSAAYKKGRVINLEDRELS